MSPLRPHWLHTLSLIDSRSRPGLISQPCSWADQGPKGTGLRGRAAGQSKRPRPCHGHVISFSGSMSLFATCWPFRPALRHIMQDISEILEVLLTHGSGLPDGDDLLWAERLDTERVSRQVTDEGVDEEARTLEARTLRIDRMVQGPRRPSRPSRPSRPKETEETTPAVFPPPYYWDYSTQYRQGHRRRWTTAIMRLISAPPRRKSQVSGQESRTHRHTIGR